MADDAGIINDIMTETSFLYGGNAGFVEDLYARWAADPTSVEPSWQAFSGPCLTVWKLPRHLQRVLPGRPGPHLRPGPTGSRPWTACGQR